MRKPINCLSSFLVLGFLLFSNLRVHSQLQDSTILFFSIIPGQVYLKIDGVATPYRGAIKLPSGKHDILVWQVGYELFDTTITLQKDANFILKKKLKVREDYLAYRKEFKQSRLKVASAYALFSAASLFTTYQTLKNTADAKRHYDLAMDQRALYLEAAGVENVESIKEGYNMESQKRDVAIKRAFIYGTVTLATVTTSYFVIRKLSKNQPVYEDPGRLTFDSACIGLNGGNLLCTIKLKLQ